MPRFFGQMSPVKILDTGIACEMMMRRIYNLLRRKIDIPVLNRLLAEFEADESGHAKIMRAHRREFPKKAPTVSYQETVEEFGARKSFGFIKDAKSLMTALDEIILLEQKIAAFYRNQKNGLGYYAMLFLECMVREADVHTIRLRNTSYRLCFEDMYYDVRKRAVCT